MNQIPNIEENNTRGVEEVIKEFDEMPFGVTIPFNQDMMWGEKEGFEADGREEFKQWLRTTLHHQLQKAREEERERIVKEYGYFLDPVNQRRLSFYLLPHSDHSELDQDVSK